MKKIISLLMVFAMVFSLTTVAFAEVGNVTFVADKDTVAVGETITITLSAKEMTVSTFGATVVFDQTKYECVSIESAHGVAGMESYLGLFAVGAPFPTMFGTQSTVAEANGSGYVGFGIAGSSDASYQAKGIAKITFKALSADAATFTLEEDSDGAGLYKGVVDTIKVNSAPVVPETPADPEVGTATKADNVKTWNVKIDGGYVKATDKLIATLSNVDDKTDTQVVTLDIGSDIIDGDADWAFSFKATFTNANMMDKINLAVAKN